MTRAKSTTTRIAATLLAVGGVATGLAAIAGYAEPYGRIDGEKVPPVAVAVAPARHLPGYAVTRSFVGMVEARRESRIGFELGGEIAAILADEGDVVEAGAVLARLDTSILDADRAMLAAARDQARADLELAVITRDRVREMRAVSAASVQEWDEADKARQSAAAALARADAAVAAAETRIARSVLVAPFAALVAGRLADEGQVVAAGTGVLDLLERVEPEVRIGVAGDSIDAVAVGGRHDLRVRDRLVPATVRSILPVRGNGTRSVDVILTLHTEFDGIRRGDLATLSVERTEPAPGFWLPLSALTESSRGLWACYVTVELPAETRAGPGAGSGTHVLRRRELEVVHHEADRVFVRGTLADGEPVVLAGLQRLVPDQTVRIASEHAFTTLDEINESEDPS